MSADTDTVACLIKTSTPNVSYISRDTGGEMRRSWWGRQHTRRVHGAVSDRETMGEPGGQVRKDTVATCQSWLSQIIPKKKKRNISPHGMAWLDLLNTVSEMLAWTDLHTVGIGHLAREQVIYSSNQSLCRLDILQLCVPQLGRNPSKERQHVLCAGKVTFCLALHGLFPLPLICCPITGSCSLCGERCVAAVIKGRSCRRGTPAYATHCRAIGFVAQQPFWLRQSTSVGMFCTGLQLKSKNCFRCVECSRCVGAGKQGKWAQFGVQRTVGFTVLFFGAFIIITIVYFCDLFLKKQSDRRQKSQNIWNILGLPFGKGCKVEADFLRILRVSDLRHLLSNYQQAMQDEQEQHHWQFKVRPATELPGP